MRKVVINIRASKNISGLVKVSVTSPAGLLKFFLNVEPCTVIILDNNYFTKYTKSKKNPSAGILQTYRKFSEM